MIASKAILWNYFLLGQSDSKTTPTIKNLTLKRTPELRIETGNPCIKKFILFFGRFKNHHAGWCPIPRRYLIQGLTFAMNSKLLTRSGFVSLSTLMSETGQKQEQPITSQWILTHAVKTRQLQLVTVGVVYLIANS